jgi:hypothetical protein
MNARPIMHRSRIVTVTVALVVSACSSDHGTSQVADTTAATTVAAPAESTATTVLESATTLPAAVETSPADTTAPEPAAVMFGDLVSPCGPGDAAGATAKGVTDSSITFGYGDDAGYSAAPGLDKEMGDAIRPLIEWCNEQGGINGREVIGNYYDAAVLNVSQAITTACSDEVFMLVGQGWVLDSAQEQTRIECQLSTIPGFAVATAFAHGSGVVQPIPNPGDDMVVSGAMQIAALFPDGVTKAANVFAEFPATRETRDKAVASYGQAGWTFLDCDQIYSVAGEADWKPIASNLEACGVEVVNWVGSPDPNLQNLLVAARQVGFEPQAWLADPNQYTTGFATWNGQNDGAAADVYVRMAAVPFELADQAPAVAQYLELVNGSGGLPGLLGVQSTSAFLLWATAVQACGSEVTARCVLGQAASQTGWTGGGLHLPADPGSNHGPACGLLLKLEGPEWVKVAPTDELFECRDEYLASGITTDALTAAALDADRIATVNGTYEP